MGSQIKSKFWLFCLLLLPLAMPAQNSGGLLDEENWKDHAKDLDYQEKERAKRNLDLDGPNFNIDWEVLKYVFFAIVLGVLLFFLVRYLLSLKSNANPVTSEKITVSTLQEAEENPMQADMQNLIPKLIAQKKYREATRAYFLWVLQDLNQLKWVEYKKPKTNFDYVREVNTAHFQPSFSMITARFERVWYGHQSLAQNDFAHIESDFKNLIAAIHEKK